jgi:hypothetical protein
MILLTEGSTDAQASEAEKVMHLLCAAYPGHPWAVRVDKGIIFIRHLAFGTNWGMNLKTTEADHDAAVLKRTIVRLAGEWLERAGLKRGRYEDQEVNRVEGVPEKYQPQPLNEEVKIILNTEPERTAPRLNGLAEA